MALLALMPMAKADISGLKQFLKDRNSEPRLYLKDSVIIGNQVDLLVVAPGASRVQLLGSSTYAGIQDFPELGLRLGQDYKELGAKDLDGESKVSFSVPFKDNTLVETNYFFEALILYPDGSIKKASTFGANGSAGYNTIRISAEPQKGGAANYDLKNTLFPGLGPLNFR